MTIRSCLWITGIIFYPFFYQNSDFFYTHLHKKQDIIE